jgi:hypothetical protein
MESLGINAIKSQLSINPPLLIGSRLRRTGQIVSIVALVCTGADTRAQSNSANFPPFLPSSGSSERATGSVSAAEYWIHVQSGMACCFLQHAFRT